MLTQEKKSLLQERLYWRQKFFQTYSTSDLPLDYKRFAVWQGRYFTLENTLEEYLSNRLNHLTKNNPLSLLTLFLSAWSVLLHRYTGEDEMVLGTPVYLEKPFGDSDNVISIRIQINGKETFKDLLKQVRSTLLEAFEHQTLPYEEFLNEVGLKGKKNRSLPFSQILSVGTIQQDPSKERYRSDLFFRFDFDKGRIKLKVDYNPQLYLKTSLEVFIQHFLEILDAVVTNIDITLEKIRCLTREEVTSVETKLMSLVEQSSSEKLPCLHHIFESMVSLYPDKIAIEIGSETLTYKNLNERANRVANFIRGQGISPSTFIGFVGDRSFQYCIAILGILKAGCAFVPVDYRYPLKRVETIIKDSQVKWVFSTKDVLQTLSALQTDTSINWIDVDQMDKFCEDSTNPTILLSSEAYAYMIYTSGSTGIPKGAIVRHNGKTNHILASHASLGLTHHSNCLFSASISTDISIWQAFTSLLCGGKTVIIKNETLLDVESFWNFIEQKEVEIMQFVPSFLEASLFHLKENQVKPPNLSSMKTLILAGEELIAKLVNQWFGLFPHIPILNAYGPTEASDIVCQEWYREPINPSLCHLSIGKSLPGIQLFILDHKQRSQPVLAKGEIYIAGVGIGVGYWNNPKKTLDAFIQNPFNSDDSHKWYRTGDFGRQHPDGKIEYLGRMDNQVKIRGYRVELGEIESCILNYSRIKEAKVVLKKVNQQDCICLYLVLADTNMTAREELQEEIRKYLHQHLPEYMIPNFVRFLDCFPILSGGKIDIQALPLPDSEEKPKQVILPESHLEKATVSIVANSIGIFPEKVGMESNFFDLGGTSIHLMSIKHQIKKLFEIDIPVEFLFQSKTIKEISQYLETQIAP